MRRLKTHDEYVKELELKNNNIIICSKYQKSNIKIHCKCKICNHEWDALPRNLLFGRGCPKCGGSQRKSTIQFIHDLKCVNNSVTILGEYINNKTKILCKCNICNETFEMLPRVLLRGCIHKKCANDSLSKDRIKSQEAFILDLFNINENIELISEYKGNSKKVTCKCKKCKHTWTPFAGNLMKGQGCPKCNLSKGEIKIDEYLKLYNIDYIPQKTFDGLIGVGNGLLSYDFYLHMYNILIEYQGRYHDGTVSNQTDEDFIKQQEHDQRKQKYALDNNIKLLEIWYWDFNKIEEILIKELDLNSSSFLIA